MLYFQIQFSHIFRHSISDLREVTLAAFAILVIASPSGILHAANESSIGDSFDSRFATLTASAAADQIADADKLITQYEALIEAFPVAPNVAKAMYDCARLHFRGSDTKPLSDRLKRSAYWCRRAIEASTEGEVMWQKSHLYLIEIMHRRSETLEQGRENLRAVGDSLPPSDVQRLWVKQCLREGAFHEANSHFQTLITLSASDEKEQRSVIRNQRCAAQALLTRLAILPLPDEEKQLLLGSYAKSFGAREDLQREVARAEVSIQRYGGMDRPHMYQPQQLRDFRYIFWIHGTVFLLGAVFLLRRVILLRG